jgi:hypothetical protein
VLAIHPTVSVCDHPRRPNNTTVFDSDGWAGYRGGTVVTAPFRVSGSTLRVSVDGGATGVQVGVYGDPKLTVENCDPIKGKQTDAVVTWKGASNLGKQDGAIALEFKIPSDATAFAFSM